MRVVFMGTPRFAEIILEGLIGSKHELVGVITRPDAVRGRGKKLVSSPVKRCTLAHNIAVYEYSSLKSDDAYNTLNTLQPDVICVAAYGAILPKRVLDYPKYGCLNVHGSLLPRWRGAAPVERAILSGDTTTGICIMRMEEGLDTGDVALVKSTSIGQKSSSALSDELATLGAKALVEVLDKLDAFEVVQWNKQAVDGVTYAEKIAKGELDIHPALTVREALLYIQASSENHPCRCTISGKGVTVLSADSFELPETISINPGSVLYYQKRLLLGLGNGVIDLQSVKPDGKKEMEGKSFAAGIQGIKQGGITWGSMNEQ